MALDQIHELLLYKYGEGVAIPALERRKRRLADRVQVFWQSVLRLPVRSRGGEEVPVQLIPLVCDDGRYMVDVLDVPGKG